jgi:hypothetical protein
MKTSAGKKWWSAASKGALKTAKWSRAVWLGMILVPAIAGAQTFTFEIGGPIATQDFRVKSAAFAFRTSGCPDTSKVEVSARGEGMVGTDRRSMALTITPSARPGVYAVTRQWESGNWLVILKGSCGSAQAGAIIPVGRAGFVREASKFYSHAPSAAEIDAAIKAIPEGGYK